MNSWIVANEVELSKASLECTIPQRRRGEGLLVLAIDPIVFEYVHKNQICTDRILDSSMLGLGDSFSMIVSSSKGYERVRKGRGWS